MTSVTVQPAGLPHAAVCAAVHAEAFARPWQADDFAGLLALPIVRGALALEGGAPVGVMLIQVVAGEAEILTIGVRPAMRQRGIGAVLMAWAVEQVRGEGGQRLFLEVAAGNIAGRALYTAAGFTQIAVRCGYYEGGIDAVVMALEI